MKQTIQTHRNRHALLACAVLALLPCLVTAQEGDDRIVVNSIDDLPRLAYPVEIPLTELITSEEAFAPFAARLEEDIEGILAKYDIRDRGTLRGFEGSLATLYFLKGDLEAAREKSLVVQDLQDKPADRLTSGLLLRSLIEARQSEGEADFAELYRDRVSALPYEVVQDNLESSYGSLQIFSENFLLGVVQSNFQPAADNTGEVSLDIARSLANIRFSLTAIMPIKDQVVEILGKVIEENRTEKQDIWAERTVVLPEDADYTPVTIAVWDSGTDVDIFLPRNQVWINEKEPLDGEDNDGNGWVDDRYGIAHDLEGFRTTGVLLPLSEEEMEAYPEARRLAKGLDDLQAAIETDEAAMVRQRMAELKADEVEGFLETLGLYGNYMHGTHVSGIAVEGNPFARILVTRITFDYRLIPPMPPIEEVVRSAMAAQDVVDYFKANGVRIVNMSWGGSQSGYEGLLEANGVGDSPEMRKEIARILFEIGYDALYKAMASAPEILFVTSAGNSDEDVEFNKVIPSSIDLPNVLVVGAVDQAGEETDFTSYGANIRVHASGFEVESFVPGGETMKFSGTSMSSPNVSNLAGKILAINPELSPEEVIDAILAGVEVSEDGRRFLINPVVSVQKVLDAQ